MKLGKPQVHLYRTRKTNGKYLYWLHAVTFFSRTDLVASGFDIRTQDSSTGSFKVVLKFDRTPGNKNLGYLTPIVHTIELGELSEQFYSQSISVIARVEPSLLQEEAYLGNLPESSLKKPKGRGGEKLPQNTKLLYDDKSYEVDVLVDLQIEFDWDYDMYTIEDLHKFLTTLKTKLISSRLIEVLDVKQGSVIIKFRMAEQDANNLMRLYYSGELNEFNAKKVKILELTNNEPGAHSFTGKTERVTALLKEYFSNKDLLSTLFEIEKRINPTSRLYDKILILKSRLHENQANRNKGMSTREDVITEMNNLRISVLSLINQIEIHDLL